MTKRKLVFEVIFVLTAILTGINMQLNWFAEMWQANNSLPIGEYAANGQWFLKHMNVRILLGAIGTVLLFYLLRELIRLFLRKSKILKNFYVEYVKYDSLTYLAFLVTCSGYVGVKINFFLTFMLFIVSTFYLIFLMNSKANQMTMDSQKLKNSRLFVLFFISGFAALIYQVVWQRMLFQFFGVNIESVTIIVSIFMLGLGVGALIGGYFSKKYKQWLPHMFVICELSIGIFGYFSLPIFNSLATFTSGSSLLNTSLSVYALLAIPTTFMGATLPILVQYFHMTIKKVGKTVSLLYFINTIGSALASFFTVEVLFVYTGMNFSTLFAASCNITVAFLGYRFIRHYNPSEEIQKENLVTDQEIVITKDKRKNKLRFAFIIIVAAVTGFISMSQEILWIRLIGFATAGMPQVFAFLVGFVLLGIALGSAVAGKICEKYKDKLLAILAVFLIISSILYFTGIPLVSFIITKSGLDIALYLLYLNASIIAFFMGIAFPILTHYAIKSYNSVGMSVSWIYFANIVGSTVGPILTGFVLLNWLGLEKNILLLSIFTLTIGVILWASNINSYSIKNIYKPILIISSFTCLLFFGKLYNNLFEKIYFKKDYNGTSFKYMIQNRSGVLSVIEDKHCADMMIGGGIYDGNFNTDLSLSCNWISRAYFIAALKEKPKNVLEIGLSTGSWAKVVVSHSDVEKLDIVEINPGYLELIKKYNDINDILTNPKVKIYVDDGRRWLTANKEKYDFILMNTTYYWRSQANNLLSADFLKLCKAHLKDGGVIYYNSTGSLDIPYTASYLFNYVTRYGNFIAASDSPFHSDSVSRRKNIQKIFIKEKTHSNYIDSMRMDNLYYMISYNLINEKNYFLSLPDMNYITDDNLASEFRTGKAIRVLKRSWINLF